MCVGWGGQRLPAPQGRHLPRQPSSEPASLPRHTHIQLRILPKGARSTSSFSHAPLQLSGVCGVAGSSWAAGRCRSALRPAGAFRFWGLHLPGPPHLTHNRTMAHTDRDLRARESHQAPVTRPALGAGAAPLRHPRPRPAPRKGTYSPTLKMRTSRLKRRNPELGAARDPQQGNRRVVISPPGLRTPRPENRPP